MSTYTEPQYRHSLLAVEFTSTLPDVQFENVTEAQLVTVTVDGATVFSETLYPDADRKITIEDLSDLVTPYAYQKVRVALAVSCGSATQQADVIYCRADFGDETAAHYVDNHFLSILQGVKLTALGRLELLPVYGTTAATCTATYSDGTTATFSVSAWLQRTAFTVLDVSPSNFTTAQKTLIGYAITCGNRTQEYELDLTQPDCAPILLFFNSFGIQELAYCTGRHVVDPSYKRSAAWVGRIQRNYRIEETRAFKADTGPLTVAMANWWDDVFRSEDVQVCNFYSGEVQPGKQLLITDSKSSYGNGDAELPRFTFTYQYAQRNHNVVQLYREGRIFDNTFDNTFN